MIDFLNECGRLWYEPFGLMVVQNTVFLGVVFAALYWLRNASARVRYAVAVLGLVKLVVPPFMSANVTSAPTYVALSSLATLPHRAMAIPGGNEASPVTITLAGFLLMIWFFVAAGVVLHTVVATRRLHGTLRHAEDAHDVDAVRFMRETGVRVRISDRVPVPMTVGVFPETIFVPPHWRVWTASGRQAVLRHEMAHIHRRDGLVRVFETCVRALYWFHPLVPILTRRIDLYREQACDERAAPPHRDGRIVYSRQLVEIAEHLLQRSSVRGSASALMRRRNELLGRINYLTREGSAMKMSKGRTVVFAVMFVVTATTLSWYRGVAQPPPPDGHAAVELSLASDGRVTVDGKKTEIPQIGKYIQGKIGDQQAVVYIKCDEYVAMKTLFEVHAVLREAGILKVSYAEMGGGQMPLVLPSEQLIEMARTMPEKDVVHLQVLKGGKCVLGGVKLTPDQIHEFVEKQLAENANVIVSLKMADDATYSQYVHALKELKKAEANRIFINEPAAL